MEGSHRGGDARLDVDRRVEADQLAGTAGAHRLRSSPAPPAAWNAAAWRLRRSRRSGHGVVTSWSQAAATTSAPGAVVVVGGVVVVVVVVVVRGGRGDDDGRGGRGGRGGGRRRRPVVTVAPGDGEAGEDGDQPSAHSSHAPMGVAASPDGKSRRGEEMGCPAGDVAADPVGLASRSLHDRSVGEPQHHEAEGGEVGVAVRSRSNCRRWRPCVAQPSHSRMSGLSTTRKSTS